MYSGSFDSMQGNKVYDPLAAMRKQTHELISEGWPSVERFCLENDLDKSLMSKFLNGKRTEFRIETLMKIAKALKKRLVVQLD